MYQNRLPLYLSSLPSPLIRATSLGGRQLSAALAPPPPAGAWTLGRSQSCRVGMNIFGSHLPYTAAREVAGDTDRREAHCASADATGERQPRRVLVEPRHAHPELLRRFVDRQQPVLATVGLHLRRGDVCRPDRELERLELA